MLLKVSSQIYTTSRMTKHFLRGIVSTGINRTAGPERNGNEAVTYEQFYVFLSPV